MSFLLPKNSGDKSTESIGSPIPHESCPGMPSGSPAAIDPRTGIVSLLFLPTNSIPREILPALFRYPAFSSKFRL